MAEHRNDAPRPWSRHRLGLGRGATIVVTVVVVATLVPWTHAAASTPAALAITVTPSTLLVDQQTVTVDGSGYPAGATAYVVQCLPGLGIGGCDTAKALPVVADGSGAFSTGFTVSRLLHIGGTTTDCATAGACIVAAGLPPDGTTFAAADIQFDPSVPLPPDPAITAVPASGLVDRQVVTVTGSDFPNGDVVVSQCSTSVPGPGCLQGTAAFGTATAGGFTLTIQVRRLVSLPTGTTDCATTGLCSLVAISLKDGTASAVAGLEFDPNGPLPPTPTATVDPSTGLADGQIVTVTGAGFEPDAPIGVVQCVAGGPADGRGCDESTYVETPSDATGAVRTAFTVRAALDTRLGRIDCTAAPGACVVVVVWLPEIVTNAQVPISFGTVPGPDAPVARAVAASPVFTG